MQPPYPCSSVAFSGCGTLNFYQTGVAAALQEHGLAPSTRFSGASAGSGLSVLLAQGTPAKQIAQVAIDILRPHKHRNIISNPTILFEFADRFLEHFITKDTLDKIEDRVFISITTLNPIQNLLVNQFHHTDDLCRAIRASCHIPSFQKRSVLFRGYSCIDGGFTNNNPILDQNTLRVSPFFFEPQIDISPSTSVMPWWAIIVPSEKRAHNLFSLGMKDGLAYISMLSVKSSKTTTRRRNSVLPWQKFGISPDKPHR